MNPSEQTQRLSQAIASLVSTLIEITNNQSKPLPSPTQIPEIAAETANGLPRLAFSMQETAEVLGVSYITVHRLIQRGLLRSSKALRHKIIPRTEIERFLKQTME